MNQEIDVEQSYSAVKKSVLNQVTPLSKYLAMLLFTTLPFVAGWIGYSYAPEKIVEVENIVIHEVPIQSASTTDFLPASESEILKDWQTYTNDYSGWSMKYPLDWRFQEASGKAPGNVGFGPSEIKQDIAMGVNVYNSSETNISDLIESQASLLIVKKLELEPAILDGKGAIKVSSVNDSNDIGTVCFYLQENDFIYQLCSWSKSDEEFNRQVEELTGKDPHVSFKDFYESFKIAE